MNLKHHPFPVLATLERVVAVSFAFPESVLRPLVPSGLAIDTYEGLGFDDLSEALRLRLLPTPTGVGVKTPLPVGHLPSGGVAIAPAEGSGPTVARHSPCWITLDHFDPKQMTEASIQRARRLYPPTAGTVSAPCDAWPVESSSADVVFGLLAIHEFRSESERTRWFAEARRSLKPRGRVVIAEHLRDPASFLTPTRAAAWVSWSFAAFWAIRLYCQWFVYAADLWRGKRLETWMHAGFTLVWTALTALFSACGAVQVGWIR